jgi:hypothetical protein
MPAQDLSSVIRRSLFSKGGVTDSTLCRSMRLHVGDDGGSVSIHYKIIIGEEQFALAA